MLIDELTLFLKAGKGGDGSATFRREKYIPKGGPWGGDGGKGGDVYLKAVEDIGALRKYQNKKEWTAEYGGNGGSAKKTGKNGEDLYLPVPVGTMVTEEDGKTYELLSEGQTVLVVKGGVGGRGNVHFATATNQTPKYAEPGKPGEERELKLELKLIADIGFIGLPNVGKSSLLNELTNASAKVGNYNFTTLDPNIGVMDHIVLADIPGLIEGASKGKGLGTKFLRHITRTRVLAHCVSSESSDPESDYKIIRKELGGFNEDLLKKNELIILTKTDMTEEKDLKKKISDLKKTHAHIISVSIHDLDSIMALKKQLKQLCHSSES